MNVQDKQGNPIRKGDVVWYYHGGVAIRTVVKGLRRDGTVHIAKGYGGSNVYADPQAIVRETTDLEIKQGRNYGNTDHATSNSCFFCDNPQPHHLEQWPELIKLIHTFSTRRDKNGDYMLQLIYRREDKHLIVAYRWTSDYAYCHHEQELVNAGSSLGRGVFQPYSADPSAQHFFDTYILQQ